VVAIAYLAGAAILTLQLAFAHLPPAGVVGSLPRETAIATGVSQVIGPGVAWGVVYALLRFTFRSGQAPPPTHHRWNEFSDQGNRRRLRLTWGIELLIGVCVLSAPGVWHTYHRYHWGIEAFGIAILIVIVMVATMLGYLHGRARVAEVWPVGTARDHWMGPFRAPRFEPKRKVGPLEPWTRPAGGQADLRKRADRWWSRPVPVIIGAALAAAAVVPATAVYWAVATLPNAVVCMQAVDGTYPAPVKGVLVGQTSDRVYLGNPQRDGDPPEQGEAANGALATLSADVVDRVIVKNQAEANCETASQSADVTESPAGALSAGAINQLLATYDRVWSRHHAAHLRAWERHQRDRAASQR
jgi:hypothetical protein